ncbi:MAG: hypothetical protein WCD53_10815 [Microcoleus sp.]
MRFLLALVISAIVVVTYGSIEAVGNEHSRVRRVENMTSQSNDRNRIRSDGLELKIAEPQLMGISIPGNQSGVYVPVRFTFSVTNNTKAPIPFIEDGTLIPEIIGPDGQALHRKEPIDRQVSSGEYRGKLVRVREQISDFMDAKLFWQNNWLQLIFPASFEYIGSPINLDRSWSFETVGSGKYQIRFIYENPTGMVSYIDQLTFFLTGQETRTEVAGTGNSATPFANLFLLQPVGDNKNAVELDGIRFETFIPETALTVPNNRQNAENHDVRIGMQIRNNTLTPFYFSFYGTFKPELVKPDGRVLRGSYISDWMIGPKKSDFLLLTPGKSLTFFPDVSLSRNKCDQFVIDISDGRGGAWFFDELQPGTYQFRFRYENMLDTTQYTNLKEDLIEDELIEKLWIGRVDTPFVEFRIAQP